ncbi:MAG: hypothetical protein JSW50_02780 [Candidatus Latescibacterota bacterium]|nr:MAG: hypothetical protein JSW50_02780 [Candidatus Latescibacterota bacterium]
MIYTHTYDPDRKHVFEVIEGEVTKPLAEENTRLGLALGRKHCCRRFLLDWTKATIKASTVDIYLYALELYELGLRTCDRVAVVMSDDEDDRKNHRFFETVAKNRGWYNIHYFEDMDSATDWLKDAGEDPEQAAGSKY